MNREIRNAMRVAASMFIGVIRCGEDMVGEEKGEEGKRKSRMLGDI